MRHNNNYNQLHTQFIPNEEGAIYTPEPVHVPHKTTNIILDDRSSYEYSQPKSFYLISNAAQQVDNPFNTPAQFGLLYADIPDSGAILQINFDNLDPSVVSPTVSSSGVPGYIMVGTISMAFQEMWSDFQQFVMVKTSGVTTKMNFIIVFRRLRDQYIPRNMNMMNELTQ
jgi:hypothetical protein